MQIMEKEEEKERERKTKKKTRKLNIWKDSKLTERTLRHKKISNACVWNANVINSTSAEPQRRE